MKTFEISSKTTIVQTSEPNDLGKTTAQGDLAGRSIQQLPDSKGLSLSTFSKIAVFAGTLLLVAGAAYALQSGFSQQVPCKGEFGNKTINNVFYQACLVDGIPEGYGRAIFPSNSTYVGNFHKGMPSGEGNFTSLGYTHVGNYSQGRAHGFGTMTEIDGSRYTGEFHYGSREGRGDYTRANGDTYVGEWKGGEIHGIGTLKLSGKTHEGSFITGVPEESKNLLTRYLNPVFKWLLFYEPFPYGHNCFFISRSWKVCIRSGK